MDLPAFLLSKSVYSESIGTSRSTDLRLPFELDRRAVTPKTLARDLSGGTYLIALRDLAFQLCLPQLTLSFCFVF